MDNTAIQAQERHNNRIPYRRPIDLFNPCECGQREAVARYKGKQNLCDPCLNGICEVVIL
ncbi:hypothetical protein L3i20_v212840 [Paenibacillus sp. L3-i20]|nr:hypothetical protein L3i20_v212840 [Paenibacillus sp. L3-i20]